MEAKNLVGKLVIRTKAVNFGRSGTSRSHNYDYSFTTDPIRIVKVTENHIVYSFSGTEEEKIFGSRKRILDERWLDDNWEDYNELIAGDVQNDN